MKSITYPLLCYPLGHQVLGILADANLRLVGPDVAHIQTALTQHLKEQYRKTGEYEDHGRLSTRLKMIDVNIKPSYVDDERMDSLSHALKVAIPVIYGETEWGGYSCAFPQFGNLFYYQEEHQLEVLAQYILYKRLAYMPPEELYRLARQPKPTLESITMRVREGEPAHWSMSMFGQRAPKLLTRVAEQFPPSKAARSHWSLMPDAAWEREAEIAAVIDKMLVSRSNVILSGGPGVGKSTILYQAIRRIAQQSRKNKLGQTFWRTMSKRFLIDAKYLGDWQENCETLVEELSRVNGILWVTDLAQLLQTGSSTAQSSVAAFLLPFLQNGQLQLVGEATQQELDSIARLLPSFLAAFQVIPVAELSAEQTKNILDKIAEHSATALHVGIQSDALQMVYRLLNRHYPYQSFPGKAVRFLEQCISEAQRQQSPSVGVQGVIQQLVQQTGLSETFLRLDIQLDTQALRQYFSSRIIGQPEAVERMCTLVKIYKAELNNPNKPISTLLFTGPTGTGKTACAKALADYFFGQGQQKAPLIHIDMSEFQHAYQLQRLTGHGQEVGQLVKDIRERPFAVVLLDEIEKANPAVFDMLLSVLDEGQLIDNYGRVTYFRNAIIIMTSNLGASEPASPGFRPTTALAQNYLSAIHRHFRAEFVNRIDHIVTFGALSAEHIRLITLKELDMVVHYEGLQKRGIQLSFSPQMVAHLAHSGFDPRYGARPLQRAIDRYVRDPLSEWLLAHPQAAAATLEIDYRTGTLITQMS